MFGFDGFGSREEEYVVGKVVVLVQVGDGVVFFLGWILFVFFVFIL